MSVTPDPEQVVVETPPIIERGPHALRVRVMAFLELALPPALARTRAAWGLTEAQLPDPAAYEPYEPDTLSSEQTPMVSMGVARSRGYGRVDLDGSLGAEYRPRYAVRLYTYYSADAPLVTETPDGPVREDLPALRGRDDYAQVLMGVLLATPSLLSDGVLRVVEETLEVQWSDATRLRGDRRLAGASLAFDVEQTERIQRFALGSDAPVSLETTLDPFAG